jgi:hypothetical protein
MVLGLSANEIAYSQSAQPGTDSSASPAVSANETAHHAALLRMVRAMNLYPFAKQMWSTTFGTPGQANDPVLDRFLNEVLPEDWVYESMTEVFKPAFTGVSSRDLDDAARFLQSPVGKKYMQVVFTQMQAGKPVDLASQKWTPAERIAITKFSLSPVGVASGKMMGEEAAKALGEKLGAQRMTELLSAAQAKYAVMDDIDLQREADRVHDGNSQAGIMEQLAVIKECNDRSGRHQAEALAAIRPVMVHMGSLQPQEVLTQQSFTQVRNEMQKADDTFAQAAQAVQYMVTYTTESMTVMVAPQGLKKIWMSSLDAKLSEANNTMSGLTSTVHNLNVEMRALVDFLEAHKAGISINKEGKLIFANKDDLAAYQGLATRLDDARQKLRNQANQVKSK